MTLTLLDLYNATASQEWAMYDNDASSKSELEESLVLALNKAILEIYASYNFPFRERTHIIITIPKINSYDMPNGLIKQNSEKQYLVRYNSCLLRKIDDCFEHEYKIGFPECFCVKNDKISFYPAPQEKGMVSIDYYTLSIGENSDGEEIFSLKNIDDSLSVPIYLEELMKEAIITKTMLNSIASETDENFSAYKKQADSAFKLLVKYSKGVGKDKALKI